MPRCLSEGSRYRPVSHFADISRLDFRGSFAARVTLEPLEYLMPGLSRGKFLSLGIFRGIRVQRDNSPQLRLS